MNYIYLICGNTNYLINEELQKIIKNDNVIKINYEESSISQIIEEANYFSLDSNLKYIIVKNCSIFDSKDDDDIDLLYKYLDNPNANSVIIFISSNIDSRKKIVKRIKESFKFIEISKIDYKNIYDYINNYLKKYKYSIDYKASGYLVTNYGINLDLIINELDKLMLYLPKPSSITVSDCEKVVSRLLDNNTFHFVDACLNRNIEKAFKVYKDLKVYKIDESMLFILLYKEYKKTYLVKKYVRMHYDSKEIVKLLGIQPWQLEKTYNVSENYSEKDLQSIIKNLGVIDERFKKGIIDRETAMYNLILNLI
jgi:DNA polymerase-3 subunit delta